MSDFVKGILVGGIIGILSTCIGFLSTKCIGFLLA
jgi:F0F1-type ATP synthase assembly protein I